jgi:hypothetical protein
MQNEIQIISDVDLFRNILGAASIFPQPTIEGSKHVVGPYKEHEKTVRTLKKQSDERVTRQALQKKKSTINPFTPNNDGVVDRNQPH